MGGRRREGVRRGREVREGEIVGVWRWEGGRERGRVGGSDSVKCAHVTVRNVPVVMVCHLGGVMVERGRGRGRGREEGSRRGCERMFP